MGGGKHVPRLGVHLFELDLVGGDGDSESIEDEEASACGTLVDGANVPRLELGFILLGYRCVLRVGINLALCLSGVYGGCHWVSRVTSVVAEYCTS